MIQVKSPKKSSIRRNLFGSAQVVRQILGIQGTYFVKATQQNEELYFEEGCTLPLDIKEVDIEVVVLASKASE